jgi:hypothetical protein
MRVGIVTAGVVLVAGGLFLLVTYWYAYCMSGILIVIGLALIMAGAVLPEAKKDTRFASDEERSWFARMWTAVSGIRERQTRILDRLDQIEETQRRTIERVFDLEQGGGIEPEDLPEIEEVPRPYFPMAAEEPLDEPIDTEEMEDFLETPEESPLEAAEELLEEMFHPIEAPTPEPPIEGMSRMEMALGEKWFQRLGLILLAVAFVLILAIAVPRLTPTQIVGLDFAVAIGIALLGEFIYTKQRLRNYAKGLVVGAFAIAHIGVWGGGFFYQIPGFPWLYLFGVLIALQVLAAFRYSSPLLAIQMGFTYLGWVVWLRLLGSIEPLTFAVLVSMGAILSLLVAFGLRSPLTVLLMAFSFDAVALLGFSLAEPYAYVPVLVIGLSTIVVVTLLRWGKVELPNPEVRVAAWVAGIVFTYGILLANIDVIDDSTVLLAFGTLTAALVSAEALAPDDDLTLVFAFLLGVLTFPVAFLMERGEFALAIYPMVLAVLGTVRPAKGLAWMPTIVYISLFAFAWNPNLVDPVTQVASVWVLFFATLALHVALQDRSGYGGRWRSSPTDLHVPFVVLGITFLTPVAFPVMARELLYLVAMPLSFVLMRGEKNVLFIALMMAIVTFTPPLFLARGELALLLYPAMLVAVHLWRPVKGYAWFANPIYLSAIAFVLIPSQPEIGTRLTIAWGLFFGGVVLHSYLQWKSGYGPVREDAPTDLHLMPLAVGMVGLTALEFGSGELSSLPLALHIIAFPLMILLNRKALLGSPSNMASVIVVAAVSMLLARAYALTLGGDFTIQMEWIAAAFHLAVMLGLSVLVAMRRPIEEFTLDLPPKVIVRLSIPTLAILAGLMAQTDHTATLFIVLPVVVAIIAFYLDDAIVFNIAYFAIVGQSFIAVLTTTSSFETAALVLPLLLAPMIVFGFLFEIATKKQDLARLTQLVSVVIWFVGPPFAFGAGVQTTISWTIIGAVALAWGLSRKFPALRYLGFLLVFAVLGKVFVYDIAGLEPELRLLGVILLAVTLLAISYGYAQYRKRQSVKGTRAS